MRSRSAPQARSLGATVSAGSSSALSRITPAGEFGCSRRSGHAIPAGDLLELSALPADKQNQALAAFEEHGPEDLRPVFDALGGTVSYDELHILRLYYIASQAGREEQVRG